MAIVRGYQEAIDPVMWLVYEGLRMCCSAFHRDASEGRKKVLNCRKFREILAVFAARTKPFYWGEDVSGMTLRLERVAKLEHGHGQRGKSALRSGATRPRWRIPSASWSPYVVYFTAYIPRAESQPCTDVEE